MHEKGADLPEVGSQDLIEPAILLSGYLQLVCMAGKRASGTGPIFSGMSGMQDLQRHAESATVWCNMHVWLPFRKSSKPPVRSVNTSSHTMSLSSFLSASTAWSHVHMAL